jgi:sucrose-6-phosphate hydrolase SacC (GH32 family)
MEMHALEAKCGNQYTLPRLMGLSEDGNEIRLLPLPALHHLRLLPSSATTSHETISAAQLLARGKTVSTVKGSVLHLNALLPCALAAHASFVGVHVLSGANESTLIGWDSHTERVTIDRSRTSAMGVGQKTPMTGKLRGGCPASGQLNLTVVVDGGVLEVFANDRFAITTALWPTEAISPGEREVGLVATARRGSEANASDYTTGAVAAGDVVLRVWKLQTAGVLKPPKPYG